MKNPSDSLACPSEEFGARSMWLRSIVLGMALLGLGACSNEAMYRAIQENGRQACEEIPIAQQASCKAQYQTDYDSYKRLRDSLDSQ